MMRPRHRQFGSEGVPAPRPAGRLRAGAAPSTPSAAEHRQPGPGANTSTLAQLASLFADEPELIRAFFESSDPSASADDERALAAAFEAAAANPDYADLHYFTAWAALRLGKLNEAEVLLQHALELNPHYTDALILSAKVAQAANDPNRSVTLLNRAIAAGADYADVYVMLAGQLHACGEDGRAWQSYRRSLELNPALAEARAGLACLATSGSSEGA
jgi:tetratricopeptide (TPR) repeat protein